MDGMSKFGFSNYAEWCDSMICTSPFAAALAFKEPSPFDDLNMSTITPTKTVNKEV